MNKLLLIPAVFSIAACVQYSEISSPPVNVQTDASFNKSAVVLTSASEIRTLVKSEDSAPSREVTGAECNLNGAGFAASFTTPAIVNIPSFGATSQPLTIHCTYEGKSQTKRVEIRNQSAEQRAKNANSAGMGNFGLIGALVGAVVTAGVGQAREGDSYSYPDINVVFE